MPLRLRSLSALALYDETPNTLGVIQNTDRTSTGIYTHQTIDEFHVYAYEPQSLQPSDSSRTSFADTHVSSLDEPSSTLPLP
jgi:hypothetical protein